MHGGDENAKDVQVADHLRPMEELLQVPTEGLKDVIIVPTVLAIEFELKIELLDFISNNPFFGVAETWLENEPPNSITIWDGLVSKEDENAKDVQVADHLRPMEELLQVPTEGLKDVIIVLTVLAIEFELKIELLDFISNNPFFGL
nr:hypothetical protein [Tanacetum cinerariifolium]